MLNQFRKPNKRELIAGGDVLWKPIDKQAAMMLSKSNNQINTENIMSSLNANLSEVTITMPKKESEHTVAVRVGRVMKEKSAQTMDSGMQFAEEVAKAREILYQATDNFRGDVLNFTEEMPKALERVRAWRMTVEREVNMSVRALEDLRKFFLGEQHEKEMARLNEFVRTCERLQALSDNGTLNAVADVMLKLA